MNGMTDKTKRVAIFGYAEAKPGEELYQDAYETSRLLAKAGFVIVNGGGPGVMRASSEGAKAGGGKTIGIAFNPDGMTSFEGRDPENPLDEEIVVSNYLERTLKLLETGDAYVVFNGGTGTISEFGMAWGLAKLYFGRHKPLVFFGSWWHEIIESIGKNMKLRDIELRVYRIVNTPQEVVEEMIELIGSPAGEEKVNP